MKAFAGLMILAGMVMSTILGYVLISTILPTWLTFWAISTTVTYIGFVCNILSGI